MKRLISGILLTFSLLFSNTSVLAQDKIIPEYTEENMPRLTEENINFYYDYATDIYNFLNNHYQKAKIPKKLMKFGQWYVTVSGIVNKDGIIDEIFVQSKTESRVYTLINNQYVMTKDINKTYNRKDMSQVYFTEDFFYHPIRKKVSLKYQQEFSDFIKEFIFKNSQLPPFPKELVHDKLRFCFKFEYEPLDPIKQLDFYLVTKSNEHIFQTSIGSFRRDGKFVPPCWQITFHKK